MDPWMGFSPFAWVIGIPLQDVTSVGSLIGTKIVLNEFVAYLKLADLVAAANLTPKTIAMATFLLYVVLQIYPQLPFRLEELVV